MSSNIMMIPIEKILPNPEQPRKHFDSLDLQGLSQSILENGVILPIAVEEAGDRFILHDGERRVRASKMAGLKEIPAVVSPSLNGSGKQDRLTRALVANIQRSNLNPLEKGKGFKALLDMGLTQMEIAHRLGVSSPVVKNCLGLLQMEPEIQELVATEKLSHDERLMDALRTLPAGKARVKTAKSLADRHVTIKAGVEACERVARALRSETIPEDEIPAIKLGYKRAGYPNKAIWDALQQVGKLPPWLLVEISAREVCERCGLRDVASETTCRDCPLVQVLEKMIGTTKK